MNEQDVLIEFSKRLKYVRGYMSQEDFAESLGITRKHVCEMEKGNGYPSLDLLVHICVTYRVSPAYLLPIPTDNYLAKEKIVRDTFERCDDKLVDYLYQIASLYEKEKC